MQTVNNFLVMRHKMFGNDSRHFPIEVKQNEANKNLWIIKFCSNAKSFSSFINYLTKETAKF